MDSNLEPVPVSLDSNLYPVPVLLDLNPELVPVSLDSNLERVLEPGLVLQSWPDLELVSQQLGLKGLGLRELKGLKVLRDWR